MSEFAVAEVNEWDALVPLREEWNRLLAESPGDTLFLRHEWLGNWWNHFGAGRRPAVILARRAGRLVAALPLLEQRDSLGPIRVSTLRSTTNQHSFRYNAICARGEEEAMEAIWRHLRLRKPRWDVLVLEEVPADAPVLAPLLEAARRDGHPVGAWHGFESPYLPTGGTWGAYHASLSKNMRANLRKKRRRLEEEGEVSYRCVTAPGAVEEALRIGLELEGSGWKDKAGSAIHSDPVLTRFYTRWAELAAAEGSLRISLLEVDGTPVAFDLSTVYGGRWFDLKMGYDPAWERFSVGQLLKAEILRRCFESGTNEYDFLGASMRAKDDWAPRKRAHEWHFIHARTPLGRALHSLKFTVAPALRRLRGR